MQNLLREQDKEAIRKEYALRVTIAALILFFVTVLLNSFLLLPAYFLSRSQENTALRYAEALNKIIEFRDKNTSINVLSDAKNTIALLSQNRGQASLRSIFQTIIESRPQGVSIRGLFYEKKDDKNVITVIGVSSGREELLSFKKRLEHEILFQSVILPISNLASDENIEFSLNIAGTW